MIHEVLLALVGYDGGYVEEAKDGFVLSDRVDFLSQAERRLIEDVLQIGFFCKSLDAFTKIVRHRHFVVSDSLSIKITQQERDTGPVIGHYVYGVVLRIDAFVRDYRARVLELEGQVLREPSLPLAHLASFLEDDRRALSALRHLVLRVGQLKGGPLLDFLWDAAVSHMGVGSVHSCFWSIVEGAGQVLANQLVAWLVYGRLVDPDEEFFVGRARGQQPLWLPGSAMYGGAIDDLSTDIGAAAAQREWQSMFSLRTDMVPQKIVSVDVAKKVLFVGKAVRVLIRSGRWLPSAGASGATPSKEANIRQGCLDPEDLQEEIDALRHSFGAKSPTYVVQRSVERIRANAAAQLRELVVGEAELVQHLNALKGFYLLGYGAFYQTFLEASRPLLARAPPVQGTSGPEAELAQGPWAAAMGEHKVATDVMSPTSLGTLSWGGGTPCSTPGGASRKLPLEKMLVPRFAIRFVPDQFEIKSFADGNRQVKLIGMAHVRHGSVELELEAAVTSPVSGASPSRVGSDTIPSVISPSKCPGMLWMNGRQRIASGFDHRFGFQVHAPAATNPMLGPASALEYGCRFALCFQTQWTPGALQSQSHLSSSFSSASATGNGGRSPERSQFGPQARGDHRNLDTQKAASRSVWTSLGECVAVEITYIVQPAHGSGTPQAKVTLALYHCNPGLGDCHRSRGGSFSSPLVDLHARAVLNISAPRSTVHLVRISYDSDKRRLQALFGADAVEPAWTADLDFAEALALDLGCAHVGFCLLPIDHRHNVSGSSHTMQQSGPSLSSARDRPVSIISWRHRVSPTHSGLPPTHVPSSDGSSETDSSSWFKFMELSYEVPWPLPLVITQSCLEKYNRLFRLLLAFRHTHQELHRVCLPKTKPTAWALRAELSFFTSQVMLYFQQDVIEVSHQRLLEAIDVSKGFDEVVAAHEGFLATATSNCFLQAPELHHALQRILNIASGFCRLKFDETVAMPNAAQVGAPVATGWQASQIVRRGYETGAAQNAEMNRLHLEFTVTVQSVLRMMASMHRQGMHVHLSQLLLRLDYNNYFSGGQEHE